MRPYKISKIFGVQLIRLEENKFFYEDLHPLHQQKQELYDISN
jgi:hypothetical protein